VHSLQLEPLVKDDGVLSLEEAGEALAVGGAEVGRHDQIRHLTADDLVGPIPERGLCGMVPADDAPSVIHRHDCVEGRLEHRPESRLAGMHSLFCVTSCDELPDLTAEPAHRLEQALVGLAQLSREELHNANHPSGTEEREAECRT
jgi:hypothetical protein